MPVQWASGNVSSNQRPLAYFICDQRRGIILHMLNEQLNQYVNNAHASGIPENQIKKALVDAGWAEDVVDEAIFGEGQKTSVNIKKRKPFKVISIILAFFALLGILWFVYPTPFVFLYLHIAYPESKYPGLYTKLVTKKIVSTAPINPITFAGIQFTSPWDNPVDIQQNESKLRYAYSDGKTLSILKLPSYGFTEAYKTGVVTNDLMKFKEYATDYFGKDITASDYEYLSAVHNVSPSDVKLIMSPKKINVIFGLIIPKNKLIFMDENKARFYSFEDEYIRGIESTAPAFSELEIWKQDDYYSIIIKGATQDEIDSMLKTIR